eukprot:scaffold59640_cov50-Attheya_sp.AAC.1
MPAHAKIALDKGRIGVTFKATPPQVVKLVDNSPMHGKMVVPGSFVEGLSFADGTRMTGLSTPALLSILQGTADQEGRFLYLKADPKDLSPPGGTVVLPSGSLGVVFKGTPPLVHKIRDESPLLGRMAEGVVMDTLELADGTSFAGLKTTELLEILKITKAQEGRKIKLVGSAADVSEARRKLVVPSGKLGITFKYSPPIVTRVNDDSPVKGLVKEGMVAEVLILADGTELGGLDTPDLMLGLREHANMEGRILVLRDPAAELTGNRTVKLGPGKLYVTFKGNNPPFVVDVNGESPLYGQVKEGCYVDKLKLEDGTEYTGLDRVELIKALGENAESEGRVLYLRDRKTMPTPAGRMVPLPAGKIGVSFKGDAPRVTGIKPTSPIMGKVRLGLHVEKLIFTNGEELGAPSFDELMDGFMDSADEEGRIICFSEKPNTGTRNITLPPGKIGVTFRGSPPFITLVKNDSPLWSRVSQGFTVEKMTLPNGTEYEGLHTGELLQLLADHAGEEGRVLHLRETRNRVLPKAGSSRRLMVQPPPKKVEPIVEEEEGEMGEQPSPIKPTATKPPAEEEEGLQVTELVLPDGSKRSGMSQRDLSAALKEYSSEEGNVLLSYNAAKGVMEVVKTD